MKSTPKDLPKDVKPAQIIVNNRSALTTKTTNFLMDVVTEDEDKFLK